MILSKDLIILFLNINLGVIFLFIPFRYKEIKDLSRDILKKASKKQILIICLMMLISLYINIYTPTPLDLGLDGPPLNSICLSNIDRSNNVICKNNIFGDFKELGYPYISMIFFYLSGYDYNNLAILIFIINMLSTILIFLLTFQIFKDINSATIAGFLFTFFPLRSTLIMRTYTVESIFIFLILANLSLYFVIIEKNKLDAHINLLSLLYFSLMVRMEFVIIIPLLFVGFMALKKKNISWKKYFKNFITAFLITLPIIAFIIYFYIKTSIKNFHSSASFSVIIVPIILILYLFKLKSKNYKIFIQKYKIVLFSGVFLILLSIIHSIIFQCKVECYTLYNFLEKFHIFISMILNSFIQYSRFGWFIIVILGIIGLRYNDKKTKSYFLFLISFLMFYSYVIFQEKINNDKRVIIVLLCIIMVMSYSINRLSKRIGENNFFRQNKKFFKVLVILIILIIASQIEKNQISPKRSLTGFFENRETERLSSLKDISKDIDQKSFILMPALQSSYDLLIHTENNFIDIDPISRKKSSEFLFDEPFELIRYIDHFIDNQKKIYYIKLEECNKEISGKDYYSPRHDCERIEENYKLKWFQSKQGIEVFEIIGKKR